VRRYCEGSVEVLEGGEGISEANIQYSGNSCSCLPNGSWIISAKRRLRTIRLREYPFVYLHQPRHQPAPPVERPAWSRLLQSAAYLTMHAERTFPGSCLLSDVEMYALTGYAEQTWGIGLKDCEILCSNGVEARRLIACVVRVYFRIYVCQITWIKYINKLYKVYQAVCVSKRICQNGT
jgi:hypothetical protein